MRLLALLTACASARAEAPQPCRIPLACPTPGAVVLSADGKARFSVLGDALLRMEYAGNGTFDDRQTLAIVNRQLPVPHTLKVDREHGATTITTASLQLTYTEHAAPAPAPPPAPAPDLLQRDAHFVLREPQGEEPGWDGLHGEQAAAFAPFR